MDVQTFLVMMSLSRTWNKWNTQTRLQIRSEDLWNDEILYHYHIWNSRKDQELYLIVDLADITSFKMTFIR